MCGDESNNESIFLRNEIKRLRKSLSELTPPLEVLLKRRGFKIYRREPSEDLLLPKEAFISNYFEMMKKYSFRLFLREIIKHQEFFRLENVTRYATAEVTKSYIDFMLNIGLVEKLQGGFKLVKRPIKSFGETLEWFVSETFKKEFATEAIWGIRFKRPKVGGDYDLIAKVNGKILYMEIKSSPPKQIYQKEITAFFDRLSDLLPEIGIFFVDTELRMKDKIVPMFEEELKVRYENPHRITRMEKELFHIDNTIFIINAKDNVATNLEKVLSWYFRRGH
ncbi:MAG: hypothetical protein ACUVUQ_05925 [Thermodesulfovibrionales bacterium]